MRDDGHDRQIGGHRRRGERTEEAERDEDATERLRGDRDPGPEDAGLEAERVLEPAGDPGGRAALADPTELHETVHRDHDADGDA